MVDEYVPGGTLGKVSWGSPSQTQSAKAAEICAEATRGLVYVLIFTFVQPLNSPVR